jgi:deoxyadenosine/deoxycytidine kinase
MRIGIVGPCAAGKTTLIAGLNQCGYESRHIAQEHSYVPDMWRRISHPDVLIYLDVSYPLTLERRKMNWTEKEYEDQILRLRHAKMNANLYLQTDQMTIEDVLNAVLEFLKSIKSI